MTRLTKQDIERKLLSGTGVAWQDAGKKTSQLALTDAKARRLFAFLLASKVRESTGLPDAFVAGLLTAYDGTDDPATTTATATSAALGVESWRLQSIETEGFGGLNIWGGPPFRFDFDQESLLIDGPNGSGKSSLIGAILWALSGERPRDQAKSDAHQPMPVFATNDKTAGDWPPIACYPQKADDLKSPPKVRVTLTFKNSKGKEAKVDRRLDGGKVTSAVDPDFEVASVLLEAGLLMPARLAMLRLDDGRSRLTDAVQKLTGLDDLVAIGALAEGLCHKAREYLSYKKKELATAKTELDSATGEARGALAAVSVPVTAFTPTDTDDAEGAMAAFGKMLTSRAAELTHVVSSDLAAGLDLASPPVQHQVISAIGAAQEDLTAGLSGIPSWKALQSIAQSLDKVSCDGVAAAIARARLRAEEATRLLEESVKDPKFQLKAVAALWHSQHKSGAIDNCPLCEHVLKSNPSLAQELEALRLVGDAAARAFDDNLNAISAELESAIPAALKNLGPEVLAWEPRSRLVEEIGAAFVAKERYKKFLTKFGALVEAGLIAAPAGEFVCVTSPAKPDVLKRLNERLAVVERLLGLAEWFRVHSGHWSDWWTALAVEDEPEEKDAGAAEGAPTPGGEDVSEKLSAHLSRLSDALAKAEPYRKGAAAMRAAWKAGKTAAEIEKELKRREAIAESLAPLKSLGPLAESVAREAIEGLSDRISALMKKIHLSEQLQFHDARLHKKEGLIVRGSVGPELRIDATLIANTSWLRIVLWAFVFALREEAVEQIGADSFPLLVFDDPQSTFDSEHRHRWAQYIASLQNGPSKAQLILTTYDDVFLDLIKVAGVTGRQAMIAAAGPELGHIGIFEGESLERKWSETKKLNTPQAARDYMSSVRVYVEGLLRLMLRGEDATVSSVGSGFVLGDCREKIRQLHEKGFTPWDRPQFKKLVDTIGKQCPSIKHIEIAHHAGGAALGLTEAADVEEHWRKSIKGSLDHCFRLARLHYQLHGGLKGLHSPPPTAVLPEGYKAKVQTIPLRVLGRAAALSGGRAADGRFDVDEFDAANHKKIVLAQHHAFRLMSPTLEPVARCGDILLVKEPGEPSAKSLVVALSDDRVLARRFEIAENHSDVAVLTAQAINPRQIAPPVIARKATLTLHKVIGVLYGEAAWSAADQSAMEVCECGGESVFSELAGDAFGLVEVVGQSAEPHALDGQFLIVRKEIDTATALKSLDGKPVIAADTDDNRYFKRLRIVGSQEVVLESLDSGGDHGPVVLALPGKAANCLERIWPVAGVLFELPS